MDRFIPTQLTLARQRRGMNKARLAAAADITPRSLTEYEAGRSPPSEDTLARLAAALHFPVEFFSSAELEPPPQDAVSFRALTSMTAGQRNIALSAAAIVFALNGWIEQRFTLPSTNVPDMRDASPEAAAQAVRESWGLGVLPIRSMVHLLELHGVRVYSLAEQCRELDAFSLWHGSRPFCFLNTVKSVEHSRFDAAHELGHLVMHRHGHPHGREAEMQANDFASAFLMPHSTVRAAVPRAASLRTLIQLKKRWGVSVAALAYRSRNVGVLTEWQHRGLCIEMSRLGYRTKEPEPMLSRETSQLLQKVFSALREDGMSKADVAREMRLYQQDLEAAVFGLVMTSIEGGNKVATASRDKPPVKLSLIKSS